MFTEFVESIIWATAVVLTTVFSTTLSIILYIREQQTEKREQAASALKAIGKRKPTAQEVWQHDWEWDDLSN